MITARRWHAGGVPVTLSTDADDPATGARTFGTHPALFVYDPRPLWKALGEDWDVIDIHEEPFSLSMAEVLVLRALRRQRAPFMLYTAQNLLKRYPLPFRAIERRALVAASAVSACNRDAALIAERKGFPGRARVIPLGVDLPAPTQTERPPHRGRIVVGFLGRLVPEKGLLVLLDALASDPRLHARIAGTGPLSARIEAESATRGLADRVEYVGGVEPGDVPEFLAGIDVLAVPSLPTPSWTEQFGRVAVEAMAAGVPVVSSDAGALPDVVSGAGLVVPHGDASALANALVDAAGPQRDRLTAAGRIRAAECSWDAVAADYLALYRSILHTAPVTDGARADDAVEVIVVAYGAPDLLRRALEPVASLPVTVIDNSSMPENAALCAELGVRYRDSGANIGFGAAVNLGLDDRLVPGADVLLLNPDAVIDPEAVGVLKSALHADRDLASVGPAQIDEAGAAARVEWVFPSPARAWLEAVGLGRFIRGPRFVIGSVLLLRAAALEQVGGFDERFFLYAEETDWAYRAHRLGWHHRQVDAARALHSGAGTSTDPLRRDTTFHASQERYYRKHFGAAGWASARAAQWLGATVRSALLPGERGAAARRRARLYRLGPMRAETRAGRAH
ncbi:glycosyltransferase [Microbacterium sp. SD291]|uniref:glycosyltransferase n=1 Tax=Microbacterium sp. SD291 TaxID=2782007 RepID=UPI0027DDC87B|nr:glycosyltransferase [Microbacterium sp. SD291]